ncbi:MAG: radical SAM protein [Dehalococcoidales bacterium]
MLIIRKVQAKTILSVSKIHDYVINPYTGCQHACSYCYARFMKRFTGHREPWGEFVDAKINAPELLRREIVKKKAGTVWVSGVCDPYQPLEAKYQLTRQCLAILAQHDWPVVVQTRSPLVLRDIDIIKDTKNFEVGFSITTADDSIRQLFEPHAPAIWDRIAALDKLHRAGIRTYAMIAPMLPGTDGLIELLQGKVDYILVDRMNYNNAVGIYRQNQLEDKLTDEYFRRTSEELAAECTAAGIDCNIVF